MRWHKLNAVYAVNRPDLGRVRFGLKFVIQKIS